MRGDDEAMWKPRQDPRLGSGHTYSDWKKPERVGSWETLAVGLQGTLQRGREVTGKLADDGFHETK
jgi:hypothetical protein